MILLKDGARRILLLDEIRGFAIICMVFHHMFYNIGFVLGYDFGYKVFNALCVFQPFFWAAFIVTSGICSRLSRNTIRRGAVVLGGGLAVTLVSAVIMPLMGITGAEIYFGILSCLGCCMIITGLLTPLLDKINTKIGLTVCAFLFLATYNISKKTLLFGLITLPDILYQSDWLCPLGFYSRTFTSADYFALLPWLFLFLFGAFIGKYAANGDFPEAAYKSHSRFLQKSGKYSFWIYLAHQPVMYVFFYAYKFIQAIFQ
ncbi:MAG: DUF1624 domain-containing protein [Eubacterium sp.]|nr:DUF1624 domain-containing protein [Eubacterium sp.]